METNKWFDTACAIATGVSIVPGYLAAQQKPHIILIVSDQHRGDAMHCMGNSSVVTPNLDALADDGTLFLNGYSSYTEQYTCPFWPVDGTIALASWYAGIWQGRKPLPL